MSEKVLHRVFGTNVIEGWRVVQVDAVASAGSAVFALFDSGSNVGREMLVNELAYLAARVDELEAEKAKLRARVKSLLRGIEVQRVQEREVLLVRTRSLLLNPGAEGSGPCVPGVEEQSLQLTSLGDQVEARAYVLATGGKSHPETGSTGDGFRWLEKIGHAISAPRPALVPLRVREPWIAELSGASFEGVKLSVFQQDTKRYAKTGKLLFTHFGLSGPLALNMSRDIDELLKTGEVSVSVDLQPSMNVGEIDTELISIFELQKNRQLKNGLEKFTKPLLVPVLLRLARIDGEKPVHSVTRAERLELARVIKDIRLTIAGLLGAEHAIVTSGGVELEEVDCRHMRSRLYPNLYLVGDILNIDRPSGGYSLQLCWTTGFVAGTAAAEYSKEN